MLAKNSIQTGIKNGGHIQIPKSKREKIKEITKGTIARLIKEIAKSEGILAAIGDGVSIIDRTFKILYQNKAETDMMGDHIDELCFKAYARRQGVCGGCPIAKTFKDGKIHTVQRKLKTDKEIRYAEITTSPLKDPEGKVIAGIEIVRDIAERKKIEEKLKESEEKFRLSFENAKDAIFWVNPETSILINCNKAAETLLEKSKEEIIGSHRRTLHPPHKLKEYDKDFKRHAMQKRPSDVELEVITKSGKIKTVLVSDTVTFIEGQPIIQGIFHDITKRKKVEEELKLSEEKFRELFEQAGDYAFILNPSDQGGLVIMDANEAACKIHGYTRDELVGMSMTELDPGLSKERISERIQRLLSGETLKFETVHYRKDGTSFPLEVWTKAVKITGRPLFIFSTERDITERKKAEEEKLSLEEQLQHAQKMEAIGTLAGGVAHDFNNLLTAIIGYGNLLKTEVDQNDLLMAYVTQILKSAERAANLTHNLLSFSRRQMINPRPVNVNNIINGMKSFLSRIIGEDIELSILLISKNITVMADEHQIEQVLMNLVTNARDAMPHGGRLTIRTAYKEIDDEFIKIHGYGSTGSYALISVEDTGQGMDEETKKRLFDPFFTTKEVGKGTGLGLSMSYGIIKQHNGYIDVQTEHSKGTSFNVYLPLTISTVEEDKKPEELTILKGGHETILVAEDETYVRDYIKEILTEYGYKVLEAMDGEDAIKVLHTHKDKIQLAMLDVIMPKKDGKMVYEEIKKVSPHIKVIFISGYATDILFKRGIIEEGINFISKPMSPGELLIKVREILDS